MDIGSLPLPGKMQVVVVGSQLGGGCWYVDWSKLWKGSPAASPPCPFPHPPKRPSQTDRQMDVVNLYIRLGFHPCGIFRLIFILI
jgi:hypothetical protein